MSIVRWQPGRVVSPLEADFNRLFNSFFEPRVYAAPVAQRRFSPAIDLVEGDGEYVLKADLPGVPEDAVSIEVERDVLTVSGKRESVDEQKRDGYHRIERSYGAFSRSLKLPEGVDASAIKAQFEKGVLEITIPKPEQPQPHKVAIAVGGERPVEQPAVEATAGDTPATA